jgi:hypothetical protein
MVLQLWSSLFCCQVWRHGPALGASMLHCRICRDSILLLLAPIFG